MGPGNDAHATKRVTERFLQLADFIGFGEHEVRVVRESRVAHRRAGVPAQYLTGTIGFAQAAIADLLAAAMHWDVSLPAIEVWSKLLILQLDLLLAPYEAESLGT